LTGTFIVLIVLIVILIRLGALLAALLALLTALLLLLAGLLARALLILLAGSLLALIAVLVVRHDAFPLGLKDVNQSTVPPFPVLPPPSRFISVRQCTVRSDRTVPRLAL
jgi:hypothetical protein